MKAPISSVKHYVQQGITQVTAGTMHTLVVVQARKLSDVTAANQVVEGSVVKAVFVELWSLSGSQQPGSVTMTVEKQQGNSDPMTFSESADLMSYRNKKNIFYTTQGLVGDANSNPTPFYRSWIKIPKGKQRFGLYDQLNINFSANLEDQTICGVNIYKSYD